MKQPAAAFARICNHMPAVGAFVGALFQYGAASLNNAMILHKGYLLSHPYHAVLQTVCPFRTASSRLHQFSSYRHGFSSAKLGQYPCRVSSHGGRPWTARRPPGSGMPVALSTASAAPPHPQVLPLVQRATSQPASAAPALCKGVLPMVPATLHHMQAPADSPRHRATPWSKGTPLSCPSRAQMP